MIKYKYELKEIDFVSAKETTLFCKDGSVEELSRGSDKIFDVNSLLRKIFPEGKKILLCYLKDTGNIYADWQFEGFVEVKALSKKTGRPIKYGKSYTSQGAGLTFPKATDKISD